MSFIDMRTIAFMIITGFICTLPAAFLWKQNHRRYPEIIFWGIDFGLQTIAILFIFLRGFIPSWISSLTATTCEVNEHDLPLSDAMQWLNRRAGEYFDEGIFTGMMGFCRRFFLFHDTWTGRSAGGRI